MGDFSMKGSQKIIDILNKSLEGELYATMQYILHSESCEDLGYQKLAAFLKKEAIQEMGHAEKLIERILFLEGTPKLQMNRQVSWEKEIQKNLDAQLAAEFEGIDIYKKGVNLSRDLEDTGTRNILESIIKDEEDHVDWIEAQLGLLVEVGVENYLAQQMYNGQE
jgi:bacterioferritin